MINELGKKYWKKFKENFKTITVDNGSEFLDYNVIKKSIKNPRKQSQINQLTEYFFNYILVKLYFCRFAE